MSDQDYLLLGAPGWGSTLVEAMLTLCQAPFRFEDIDGFDQPGPQRDRLLALNPMAQVPTLVLPGGEVMTESSAICLLLSERYPDGGLAPPPGDASRPRFLRRLVWMAGPLYATFTYADYPERWAPDDQEALRQRVIDWRKTLWRSYEAELGDRPWTLGEAFSALDLYTGVMTRWGPNRPWFEAECPKLSAIARRVDEEPRLKAVWARNFPA